MQFGPRLLLVIAGIALCSGCWHRKPASDRTLAASNAAGSASASASSKPSRRSPLSRKELPTTDGALAADALSARVASAEQLLKRDPENPELAAALVSALLARGQYLGRIADYEQAARVAERAVSAGPTSAAARLARASVRSTFHRFDDALADIAEAERLDATLMRRARTQRASILQALGRYDEALNIRHRLSQEQPDLQTLGAEAALLGERGDPARHDFENAERLFQEAQFHFDDVSPWPVAWLWLAESVMAEKREQTARARELLRAARDRVPAYAHVASHLATLEPPARAAELLRPLLATSDDPEIAAQLSVALRALGDAKGAERMKQQAAERYRILTERYSEAFAEHAARFWLGAGENPALALPLTERNLDLRKTNAAYELALEAELVAGSVSRACDEADAAFASRAFHPSRLLRSLASAAYAKCGQPGKARDSLRGPTANSTGSGSQRQP